MLYSLKPKHLMIFGVICMVAGLCVFALWNVHGLGDWDIAGTHIVRWCRKTLGRYGITAFYVFGGMVIFLRAYIAMRSDERSRALQQQPTNYHGNQQQPPHGHGNNQ